VRDYSLDASLVAPVGISGEIEMPARDAYVGGKEFVFVSTNFEAKGGRVVLAAFREVRKRHPHARLTVIGDRPPKAAMEAGVSFTGYLRKEIPHESQRFQQILGSACALVNASRSDTCPLLLVEAGYVGCPVISTRKFAIPEVVDHGRTGLLLDDSSQPNALADAMVWMLEHEDEYRRMREAAWAKSRAQHSKRSLEERLRSHMCESVATETVTFKLDICRCITSREQ